MQSGLAPEHYQGWSTPHFLPPPPLTQKKEIKRKRSYDFKTELIHINKPKLFLATHNWFGKDEKEEKNNHVVLPGKA